MAAIKRGNPHGLYKVLVQLTGASGMSYGQAGSGISNGATSQSYVAHYPKSATLPTPDRTTLDFTGGDVWIGSYQYGITSMGSFEVTMAELDADLIALVTGSNVDATSNTEWREFSRNELRGALPQVSLILIYRLQSTDPNTFGQTYYVNTVIPRCQMAPKGINGGPAFQAAGEPVYQITPTSAGRKVHGVAFGSNLNVANNQLMAYHIITEYPLYMVSHRANGTSASIVGTYKPVTSSVGTASATKNPVTKFVESTLTATPGVADTVTVATATFEIGTALTPASGDMLNVFYETDYEAA